MKHPAPQKKICEKSLIHKLLKATYPKFFSLNERNCFMRFNTNVL